MSRVLATAILTNSWAFSVADFLSPMWTQEQCSRILAISKRKGFKPACLRVSWKTGSCVLGVQAADVLVVQAPLGADEYFEQVHVIGHGLLL